MLRNHLLKGFRIAVSAVLLGWLFYTVDSAALVERLAGADLVLVAAMMAGANLDRLLMAYKWARLLRARGIRLPLGEAARAYYKASFWGSLFLPTVGADALRIYEVSRRTRRPADVISSVVLERTVGVGAVMLVGLASLLIYLGHYGRPRWDLMAAAGLVLAGLGAFLGFSLWGGGGRALQRRLEGSGGALAGRLARVLGAYREYGRHRRALALFAALSLLEQFIPVGTTYLTARAVHLDIPPLAFVVFVPLVVIVVRLPISTDGIGVREGLFVYLFGQIGVPQADAFLLGLLSSVLWRVAVVLPTLYIFLSDRAGAGDGPPPGAG